MQGDGTGVAVGNGVGVRVGVGVGLGVAVGVGTFVGGILVDVGKKVGVDMASIAALGVEAAIFVGLDVRTKKGSWVSTILS